MAFECKAKTSETGKINDTFGPANSRTLHRKNVVGRGMFGQ